ncbi:hypothetical protein GCM10027592_06110 [Spirosoma flavus]
MKNVNFLHVLLVASPILANAQNYVATSPSSATPGNQNTIVGIGAGNTTLTGTRNIFLGSGAGPLSTTGFDNTFIGVLAGAKNTTGFSNVFLGLNSGANNVSGQSNLFMGAYSGQFNTTGNYNLFIGNGSGQNTTGGNGNTFIGDGSGNANTTGTQNTYIGQYAGFLGNVTASKNTFIGWGAGSTSSTSVVSGATAIGADAVVTKSNAVVIGATNVQVGIGNSSPNNKLEITAGTTNTSGLRFTRLTQSSPSSSLLDLSITLNPLAPLVKVLTVDGNGDVKLVGLSLSLLGGGLGLREGAGLWESKAGFAQNTNQEGVIIGNGITSTPKDYNLFVSKGILTEKVKVAVNGTSEWSDYVFDKSYKLKNLSAVENYIKTNKHLPGIPSAQEMVEQGNDLHKTDAKLLAKIEELTLYMIEMKKDNQQLQRAVNNLKRQNKAINQKLQHAVR